MTTGTFFARTWRYLSILGVVISLITSYIAYPGDVAFRFNEIGTAKAYINREVIFYAAVAIFLLNNALFTAVGKSFPRVPSAALPVPNQPVWAAHRKELNRHVGNWFLLLAAAINTVLALGLFVLSLVNRLEGVDDAWNFAWLMPLSTAIFAIVIVALPLRLLLKPAPDEDR
jgi:hypothetical protein